MFTKFEKNPSKSERAFDYILCFYNEKNSQNDSVSVKINSFAIKNPHAHIQYVHSVSAKFEKHPLEKLLEELNTQTPYPKVKKKGCHNC